MEEMSGSEDDPESIDNAVLCMAWMWSNKTTVANAEKLVVKHFKHSYQDVYGALVLIWEITGKVGRKPPKYTKNDKFEMSAKELIALILKLKEQDDPKVNVIMSPTTMAMIPMTESTWGEGDEASTAARLLNLEIQMNEMRTELSKGVLMMASKSLATSAPAPATSPAPASANGLVLYAEVAARSVAGQKQTSKKIDKRKVENAVEDARFQGQGENNEGFQLAIGQGQEEKTTKKGSVRQFNHGW